MVLGKLREFQDAGHLAVLVIGDWTARVGDPSGRTSTRPMLSAGEIESNAASYRDQAFRILDPERTEIRANGEWFSTMGLEAVFRLAGSATVNQLLRRNDFAERMAGDRPVSVLELLYPLMQAYDSVELRADVELGGTDQLFNLMLAREIQSAYGQPPQVVMTMPILPGLDGVRKMSKSLGQPHRGRRRARGAVRSDDAHPRRGPDRVVPAARARRASARRRPRRGQAAPGAAHRRALRRRGGGARRRGALRPRRARPGRAGRDADGRDRAPGRCTCRRCSPTISGPRRAARRGA